MGLFSDTCTTLIDKKSGKALSGERLAEVESQISYTDKKGRKKRLSGRELLNKLNENDASICGAAVKKGKRFCSKCGCGAPHGWVKCPVCKKWVGNDSHYCPHCDCHMHPNERVDFANGVWSHPKGVYALRIDIGDVRRIKKDGLQIQEGTIAVLLDGGKAVKVLEPGRYNPESNLRTINWFGNPPQRSAVLFDSGDCVFSVDFKELRSGENDYLVDMSAEITLQLIKDKAVNFIENFMKGDTSSTYDSVGNWIKNELYSIIKDFAITTTLDDLIKDPALRPQLEHKIEKEFSIVTERIGLKIIRVGAIDFNGAEYSNKVKKLQEIDQKRREIEYIQTLRDLTNSSIMTEAKDNNEFLEYMDQLAQERNIANLDRENEMKLVIMAKNHEITEAKFQEAMFNLEIGHSIELKKQANSHELEFNIKKYFYEDQLAEEKYKTDIAEAVEVRNKVRRLVELGDANHATAIAEINERTNEIFRKGVRANVELAEYKKLRAAQTDVEITRLQDELEKEKDVHKLQILREKIQLAISIRKAKSDNEIAMQKAKSEVKIAEINAIKGMSIEELIATADDPERGRQLAEIAKIKVKQSLSPQQLLALGAENSPAAAQAAAAAFGAGISEHERELFKQMVEQQTAFINAMLANNANTTNQFADVAKTVGARVDNVPVTPPATTQIIK